MSNPNDRVIKMPTPYGEVALPVDFDVRFKTINVEIVDIDGSSIASAILDNGKIVDYIDGPFTRYGAPHITLKVIKDEDSSEINLELLIPNQILDGFGVPEHPLDLPEESTDE